MRHKRNPSGYTITNTKTYTSMRSWSECVQLEPQTKGQASLSAPFEHQGTRPTSWCANWAGTEGSWASPNSGPYHLFSTALLNAYLLLCLIIPLFFSRE